MLLRCRPCEDGSVVKLLFPRRCVESRYFKATFVYSWMRGSHSRHQRNVSNWVKIFPYAANRILEVSASRGGKDSRLRETGPLLLLF